MCGLNLAIMKGVFATLDCKVIYVNTSALQIINNDVLQVYIYIYMCQVSVCAQMFADKTTRIDS